eukprot:Opistho-1_new@3053
MAARRRAAMWTGGSRTRHATTMTTAIGSVSRASVNVSARLRRHVRAVIMGATTPALAITRRHHVAIRPNRAAGTRKSTGTRCRVQRRWSGSGRRGRRIPSRVATSRRVGMRVRGVTRARGVAAPVTTAVTRGPWRAARREGTNRARPSIARRILTTRTRLTRRPSTSRARSIRTARRPARTSENTNSALRPNTRARAPPGMPMRSTRSARQAPVGPVTSRAAARAAATANLRVRTRAVVAMRRVVGLLTLSLVAAAVTWRVGAATSRAGMREAGAVTHPRKARVGMTAGDMSGLHPRRATTQGPQALGGGDVMCGSSLAVRLLLGNRPILGMSF